MNNLKGKIYSKKDSFAIWGTGRMPNSSYDRPDTFLFYLSEYFRYRNKSMSLDEAGKFFSNSIFTYSMKTQNFMCLYNFLGIFNNIYQYCKLLLGIEDKSFIDDMIASGGHPLEDEGALKNYIELAKRF